MNPHGASLLAVALVVAGCSLGPDSVRPPMALPAQYGEVGDWRPAEPRDQLPRGAWWTIFADPQLDALESELGSANPDVQLAAARLREAESLVQQAKAGLFPGLSASASRIRSQSTLGGGQVSTSVGGPVYTTESFSASLSWELDLWGRVARQVESQQAGAEASAADLESARLSAQASLVQNYFLLRLADARKRLLDGTLLAYERALGITRNRYAVGVVPRLDVVQAETQLETVKAEAIDVGVQRAQLEHAIAVLIGKAPADFSLAPREWPATLPDIPPGLPADLLERRPDIASAERQVAAANARIGVARAAFFPNLTLSATGGFQGSEIDKVLSAANHFWSVGPTLAGPLFDAGLRQAQSAQAIAAYDGTVAAYRKSVLNGLQEVEDNLAALRILAAEAEAQEKAVAASRRAVEMAINQYKAGTVSYLSVVTAQAARLNNERTALDILGRRLTASVGLVKALGGGWQVPLPASRPPPENET